jgi:hypothetical protein
MKNTNTETMIELVAKALTFKYDKDKTAPGVLVSQLKNGKWYVSAVRHKDAFGRGKEVAFKASGETVSDALMDLAKLITASDNKPLNPVDELRSLLSN